MLQKWHSGLLIPLKPTMFFIRRARSIKNGLGSNQELGAAYHVILIRLIELAEIAAPAPDAHYEIAVGIGVSLRIKKNVAVDGIQLKLMTSEINERLHKQSNLTYALGIAKNVVVKLHCQRAAVDNTFHIVPREGLYAGQRPRKASRRRR